uniref:Synovial sarcoma, X breakpoint 2 interacting protein b n=1 Tax=Neogobius melanostomus TaxID=47308 RepID=A0A8C6SC06_9GOBI
CGDRLTIYIKDSDSSPVEYRASPQRLLTQSTLHRNSILSSFCTEENVQECLFHITQELASLGLSPVGTGCERHSELDVVAVLNCMNDLIQLHRRELRTLENMEVEQLKSNSSIDYLQITSTQLKEQLELSKRENTGLLERERQLQLKVKSLENHLKNEKEESEHNMIFSLSCKNFRILLRTELKESKVEQHLWKTDKTEARHEGEMYKTLLNDYDNRQRELLLENAELKKVLENMKKDMVSILKTKKTKEESDDEDIFDATKERVELFSDDAREKLTNGIRLQWRKLKSHVERLDNQGLSFVMFNKDSVSRETHEEEMHKLRLEIQQCKDYIRMQQQLLQRQLSSPCDEEVTSLLNNCYMQQEKERLKGDWKTLEEQRKIFDRERGNFTEAAIRLSHERKVFEENRALWLKHQFLNSSPFPDSSKPQISRLGSASSICKSIKMKQNGHKIPSPLCH